jgi:hypothetical protein
MSDFNSEEALVKILEVVDNLQGQLSKQKAVIEYQQNEINQLKAAQTVAINSVTSQSDKPQSRRKLLKRMAVVAMGATAATTALATTTGEANASAIGTVAGASNTVFGLTAAPNGITPYAPPAGRFGLVGITDPTNLPANHSSAGVFGHSNTATGVFGNSNSSFGVHGKSNTNVGIFGQSETSTGVVGNSFLSYGGSFVGSKADLFLNPFRTTGIPTTGLHFQSELLASAMNGSDTHLYYCTKGDGTGVGTWVRLNQPYTAGNNITISPRNADGTFTISATGSAAPVTSVNGQTGAVVLTIPPAAPPNINLLPSPVRVAATLAPFNAPLLRATAVTPATGNSSTVQVTIAGTNGIPAGAKGVVGVLTNVGATNGGNLRFWTGGNAPAVANLNIPGAMPSLNLTASFAIPLDAAGKTYLGFGTGAVGATCGYVVDVSGYWL